MVIVKSTEKICLECSGTMLVTYREILLFPKSLLIYKNSMHLDQWTSFFSHTHQLFQAGIYLKSEFLKPNFNMLIKI